jgi:hypothetical protein
MKHVLRLENRGMKSPQDRPGILAGGLLLEKVPPPEELMQLTALTARRLPAVPTEATVNSYSASEGAIEKALTFTDGDAAKNWSDLLERKIIRVYPSAQRVLSENFNPQPLFSRGVQMVALNWQTPGPEISLQHGWFSQNRRSGYVLKQAFLREGSTPSELTDPVGYRSSLSSETGHALNWFSQDVKQPKSLMLSIKVKFAFGVTVMGDNSEGGYFPIEKELRDLRTGHNDPTLNINEHQGEGGDGSGYFVRVELFGTEAWRPLLHLYAHFPSLCRWNSDVVRALQRP